MSEGGLWPKSRGGAGSETVFGGSVDGMVGAA
jgi:hypothetical protein